MSAHILRCYSGKEKPEKEHKLAFRHVHGEVARGGFHSSSLSLLYLLLLFPFQHLNGSSLRFYVAGKKEKGRKTLSLGLAQFMWKSFLLYICHSLKATSDGGGEEKFLDEDAFEGMITESLGMHTHGDV
jgi:hypothetical protein